MRNQLIHDELQGDAYSGLGDAQVLERLNAQDIEYFIEPSTAELQNFLYNQGLYAKLVAVYRDHPNQAVRVAAECAIDLGSSQIQTIALHANPVIAQMLQALVVGQVWTQAQADSVLAFARRTRSRAEELLGEGVVVTLQDITAARLHPKYVQAGALAQSREDAHQEAQQAFRNSQVALSGALSDLERGIDRDLSAWEVA